MTIAGFWGAVMRTGVGGPTGGRRWRRMLATVATGVLVSATTLLGSSAMADNIDPEEYPPPPVEEEVAVSPPEPFADQPELARTGVELAWPLITAAGAGLLVVGTALVVVRRRLTHD